jgi:heterodisulfide reductase subunit B2
VEYSYYPGCSAHSTGLELGLSTDAIFHHLGLKLAELPDWNCCGATSAHSLNHTLALALPARNLALAQEAGRDLVIPCAACYNRMRTADHVLRQDEKVRAEIEAAADMKYSGTVAIRPLLAVVAEDVGLAELRRRVVRPLSGLKVVSYYGCLLVRPPAVVQFDNPDDPQVMPSIVRTLGAEVLPWSHATDCCGGGVSLTRADIVAKLVGKLAERASEAGAQAFVSACPLCQMNLEMRQRGKDKLPSFYFTELMGLAFGLPDVEKWWTKHLIDPRPLLRSLGLVGIPASTVAVA